MISTRTAALLARERGSRSPSSYYPCVASAFVLGGTGQIGRAVCSRLLAAGWEVTCAGRGNRVAPEGVRSVRLDRREPGALESALGAGADVLVDVMAMDRADAEQVAALGGAVGSLVAISSALVYADAGGRTIDEARDAATFPTLPVPVPESHPTVPPGPETYSTRKAAVEETLLAAALPATVLRPCAVHGPWASSLREWYFVKRALDGRRVVVLADRGESRFHTTSAANLAELVLLAAERPGTRVLNCGDPAPPTVLAIERAIASFLEHEWKEVLIAEDGFAAPAARTPWSVPQPVVLDMQAAEDELGYRPVGRYEEAVRDTVAWLVEQIRSRDWREVLPGSARNLTGSFDYEGEDALARR